MNAKITQTINNKKFVTLTMFKTECVQQGWKWLFTIR